MHYTKYTAFLSKIKEYYFKFIFLSVVKKNRK